MSDIATLCPPPLRPGDRVAVISPSGPLLPEHAALGLEALTKWGLEPVLFETFARSERRGYLAGDDATRAGALARAIADPSIRAILCARGGYGAMRALERVDLTPLRDDPKLVVGFSDVTALHLALDRLGVRSLHGPVLKSFRLHADDPHDSLGHLKRALFGERGAFRIEGLARPVPGSARGRLVGGNLSLVAAMRSGRFAPSLSGTILFLEDVGETDYRLDRLFTSLRQSEEAPAAIVLGDFTGCGGVYVSDEDIPKYVASLAAEFGGPVASRLPVGHASRNVALPVGAPATLEGDALVVHEDATSPNTDPHTEPTRR